MTKNRSRAQDSIGVAGCSTECNCSSSKMELILRTSLLQHLNINDRGRSTVWTGSGSREAKLHRVTHPTRLLLLSAHCSALIPSLATALTSPPYLSRS